MRGDGRSRRSRRQTAWSFLAVAALIGTVFTAWIVAPASAATGFATPAFQAQWMAGEAITPNFWGPLSLARDGQAEQYLEGNYNGVAGQRLVQYFDKARMELTNPASGVVTSGLLATELISGKLQVGDNTFQTLQPAAVPIAGDPDNIGPTYASIGANAATLQSAAASTPGAPTTRLLGPTGTLGTYSGTYASDPQGNIATYDATTQHNVPAAFLNFRNKVNLLNIGFGISEPFWSTVKVAGAQKDVLVQAFERRVLTYTPTNPDPFKVEFGNIGQHYYAWRTSPQNQTTPTPSVTATPTTGADTTAPKFITAPETPYQTPNSFTVMWKTNEPASSEVKFGTSTNYESINDKLRGFFTYDHYVVINGLTAGGTYHYRIQSRDAAGNLTVDDQDRAITLPLLATVPVNSAITVSKNTATTFTVTWTTNVPAFSRIEFGQTNGVYDRFRKGDNGDPLGVTHAATAISLEPGKIYYFRIVSILNTPRADASASDDAPTPLVNNTAPTIAATSSLTISDLKATQDKTGSPLAFTFTTSRPASVVIAISPSSKLDANIGFIFGSLDDFQGQRDYLYPPFTRNLHNISGITLPAGTWYYRVTVYDEQGTGVSDIKSVTVT